MANGPDGKRFVWGRIVQVHMVGPYDIVEHIPTKARRGPSSSGLNVGKHQHRFHPYVAGQDTNVEAPTLDGALCLAIAYCNGNVSAATYMMKLISKDAT